MSRSERRKQNGRLPAIRCYEEESLIIREKAADCGLSIGKFLLAAALKRQTRSKVDLHVLNELRRLGGLQKKLFNDGKGVLSKEYSSILVEIRSAISRIGE